MDSVKSKDQTQNCVTRAQRRKLHVEAPLHARAAVLTFMYLRSVDKLRGHLCARLCSLRVLVPDLLFCTNLVANQINYFSRIFETVCRRKEHMRPPVDSCLFLRNK